mmetsp:Transcript_2721/g.4039  ORF Transcript_2721/g.4039 Transcript_2721/m.4039 type:complete len:110 (+) Transcript_2721:177-506(+)|eukprot:CAMPEP_0194210804 /NCGR_PEP_ID=MMETSP0156-20130528/9119_1 /TAXON_ID=33649 /ORGANISM="Thalassionema nitzschioides, Strain L26-B" /LENGTH=109 /DNA_ID=CAMNT_0038938201 /DNA_START=133 /DNA_END=462 /DNA_ORIENTATION=+
MGAYLPLSIFSFVGALFMLFVAILITTQPFFIGGIEDFQKARGAAYGAMWAYVITFILSVILDFRDAKRKHRESVIMRSTYGQVPNLDIQEYDVQEELPSSSVDEGVFT